MYILYSTFVFSLLGALGMVFYRLREIKNGRIPFPDINQFSKQFHIFALWEKKIWEGGKNVSIRSTANFLRFVMAGIDKMRKMIRKLINRMEENLVKKRVNDGLGHQGAASFFLKDIAEHKKRIKMKMRREK